MRETQEFANEFFSIQLLMSPRCKAVVSSSQENTCQCLKNFLYLIENREVQSNFAKMQQLKDSDGKLFFKKCGSGDMKLLISKTDKNPLDLEYIKTYTHHLNKLIQEVFAATDDLHIKEGSRQDALEYDSELNGYTLYLHRGLPKRIADEYPQVTIPKKGPALRRS